MSDLVILEVYDEDPEYDFKFYGVFSSEEKAILYYEKNLKITQALVNEAEKIRNELNTILENSSLGKIPKLSKDEETKIYDELIAIGSAGITPTRYLIKPLHVIE